MLHIQFCLDEIVSEIEAQAPASLSDAERDALSGHVAGMRMVLAGCAARKAALALAMPTASGSVTATIEAESAAPEASPACIDDLPPPVAPVPAPIRIVSLAKASPVEPAVAAVPVPLPPAANVIALPADRRRGASVPLTRIAASLLIVVGLGTGAGLQLLRAHDPIVVAAHATLAQSLAEGHATLLDVIAAGRKLISRIPDLGGQKASG